MREIVFKNLTTRGHRKRDLWLEEVTEENGMHAKIRKRCVYLIRGHLHLAAPQVVEKWITDHAEDPKCRLRNLTVRRIEDSKTKTKHFYFKAVGNFYAVMGLEVFSVGFFQTYELDLSESNEKGNAAWS
ncbi:MAG: hypothetical protein ABH845_06300 [Candidatus Omnitrophota bacterium]